MKSNKSSESNSRTSRSIKRKNMMNIVMITIGAIIILAFIGTGVYNSSASNNNSELSADAIKQVVADQYPGTITEIEMKQEYNKVIYEVEVVNEEKKYDLKLDGNTGEVIKLEEKIEGKAGNDKKQSDIGHNEDNDNDQSNVKIDEKHRDQSTYKNKQKKNNPDQIAVDAKEAIDIALNEYSGIVTELELDRNNGRLYYEVEIRSGNEEAEIEIDAHTGEILVIEIDD